MKWKDIIAFILLVIGMTFFSLSIAIYYTYNFIFHFGTFIGFICITFSVFIFLRQELFIRDDK